MEWHLVDSNFDGLMRHLSDSKAYKMFNLTYSNFVSNLQNVYLGLVSDFDLFRNLSTNYSI